MLKIEAKFCTFHPLVKINGGMGEMSESSFQGHLGHNLLYTFGAGANGLGDSTFPANFSGGDNFVPPNSQS